MNKHEAYTAMLQGRRITCKYFSDWEYLTYAITVDRIEDESGFHIPNFWSNNYLFGVKWSIY